MNRLHKKGFYHCVKVNNFPGGTSETILGKIDDIIKSKPDCLTAHEGVNDLTNGTKLLNQVKKKVKQITKVSQNTKIVFSSIVIRKDGKILIKRF